MKVSATTIASNVSIYAKNSKANGIARLNEGDSVSKGLAMDKVDLSQGLSAKYIQDMLLTEVGKKISGVLEKEGIDLSQYANQDFSPEATSQRIFDFTTGFFEMYKSRHKDESEEEVINGFEKLVRSSTQKGYEEAMGILAGAGFGSEETGIAGQTMSLLGQKFDDYFTQLRENLKNGNESQTNNVEPLATA